MKNSIAPQPDSATGTVSTKLVAPGAKINAETHFRAVNTPNRYVLPRSIFTAQASAGFWRASSRPHPPLAASAVPGGTGGFSGATTSA